MLLINFHDTLILQYNVIFGQIHYKSLKMPNCSKIILKVLTNLTIFQVQFCSKKLFFGINFIFCLMTLSVVESVIFKIIIFTGNTLSSSVHSRLAKCIKKWNKYL